MEEPELGAGRELQNRVLGKKASREKRSWRRRYELRHLCRQGGVV